MNTSTEMVSDFFTYTGTLLTDLWPIVYLILGVGLFIFMYRLFGGALIKALKKVIK